ncbi:MAG: TonB-dependent receptor plug domain-containing protein [Bacteroidota bacterium]
MLNRLTSIKTIVFIFSFLFLGICSSFVNAQSNNPEILLTKVLPLLEVRFNIRFGYDPEIIKTLSLNKRILATENIHSALQLISASLPLEYFQALDGQILLRKRTVTKVETPLELTTIKIKGKLIDAWTGEILPFGDVVGENGEGFSSDENGLFYLNVRINSPVTFRYLGYESKILTFSSNKEDVTLRLVPKLSALPLIEISAKIPGLTNKSGGIYSNLNPSFWGKMPSFAAGNDVLRSLQQLPGISSNDDLSAELKVRGTNGDENLLILDGITLYNVTHFSGMFSLVNSDAIKEVKLFKNALPVSYGGKTASIIEMNTLSPSENIKLSGKISSNLLTSQAVLQGQIAPKQSILFSGRTTYGNLGDSKLFGALQEQNVTPVVKPVDPNATITKEIAAYNPNFKFHDLQGKWNWEISDKQKIQVAFFYGYDEMDYSYNKTIKTEVGKSYYYRKEYFKEIADWNNMGSSLLWNFNPSENWQHTLHVSITEFQNNASIINDFKFVEDRKVDKIFNFENTHFNKVAGQDLKWISRYAFSKEQSWIYGFQTTNNQVNYDIRQDRIKPLTGQNEAMQSAAFVELNQHTNDWTFNIGGRLNFYEKNFYFSPSIDVNYHKSNTPFSVKGSFGRYYQFLRQLNHEDRYGRNYGYWVLSNKQFPVLSSNNSMIGANLKWNNWEFDVEFYQKNSQGVLEQALAVNNVNNPDSTQRPPSFILYDGKGQTKGMDFFIQHTGKYFSGMLAYTLSKSTNQFKEIGNGIAFPSSNDRRHQLKINGNLHLGKFDFFATYNFASGRPYTDLSKVLDNNGKIQNNPKPNPGNPMPNVPNNRREVINPLDRLSYLDDYQRFDIGTSICFRLGQTSNLTIEGSIFNIFNKKNVKYRQFIFQLPYQLKSAPTSKELVVGTELQMLGITPNLNLKFSF